MDAPLTGFDTSTADEVNSIVVDVGSCLCKAGYGGDDVPKAIFPSDDRWKCGGLSPPPPPPLPRWDAFVMSQHILSFERHD
eukprot:364708-Chlamydomonas_euryale.AAC.12